MLVGLVNTQSDIRVLIVGSFALSRKTAGASRREPAEEARSKCFLHVRVVDL